MATRRITGGSWYRPVQQVGGPSLPQPAVQAQLPATVQASAQTPQTQTLAPGKETRQYQQSSAKTNPATLGKTAVDPLSAAQRASEVEYETWKRKLDLQRQYAAEDHDRDLREQLAREAREDARYWERKNNGMAFPNMQTYTRSYRSGSRIKFTSETHVQGRGGSNRSSRGGMAGRPGGLYGAGGYGGAGYGTGFQGGLFATKAWMPVDMFDAGRKPGAALPRYKAGDFGLDRFDNTPQSGRFQGGYMDPAFRENFYRSRLSGINPADQRTWYRAMSVADREWSRAKTEYDKAFQNYGRALLQRQVDEDRAAARAEAMRKAQQPPDKNAPPQDQPQPVTPGPTTGSVPGQTDDEEESK